MFLWKRRFFLGLGFPKVVIQKAIRAALLLYYGHRAVALTPGSDSPGAGVISERSLKDLVSMDRPVDHHGQDIPSYQQSLRNEQFSSTTTRPRKELVILKELTLQPERAMLRVTGSY